MGTIVIHAGMPKCGSTSLQRLLAVNHEALRDDHGITLLYNPDEPRPFEGRGSIVANRFPLAYEFLRTGSGDDAALDELTRAHVAALARAADEHGTVLISAETYTPFLSHPDARLLRALEDLGSSSTVRIALYVRPQNAALESRWRAWGYRSGVAPSVWTAAESELLHYTRIADHVNVHAPSIDLIIRPFVSVALVDGDVARDFATTVLGIELASTSADLHENIGLPLDLVGLLRDAPAEVLATPASVRQGMLEVGLRQAQIAELAQSWGIPDSADAVRSRELLQHWAHVTFEPENKELIARCGWDLEVLIPPTRASPDASADPLGALDRLWEPSASPTEAAYLHAALRSLLE